MQSASHAAAYATSRIQFGQNQFTRSEQQIYCRGHAISESRFDIVYACFEGHGPCHTTKGPTERTVIALLTGTPLEDSPKTEAISQILALKHVLLATAGPEDVEMNDLLNRETADLESKQSEASSLPVE